MIEFAETLDFKKDFKTLLKRYRTLKEDFEIMKKFTLLPVYEQGAKNSALVLISGFCKEKYESIKIRKFACRALKGRGAMSGIRVICVWEKQTRTITFVQIYTKSDHENEDRARLLRFLKTLG